MKKESLFSWQQSLIELNGNSMCPFSIRSWNGHLEHFLNDKIYSAYSGLFFFTKINISSSPSKHVNEIVNGWKDICKNTQYGLALCCNVSKVKIIEVIDIPSVLPIVVEIEKDSFYW